MLSLIAGKYGPEKLRIRAIFTQLFVKMMGTCESVDPVDNNLF